MTRGQFYGAAMPIWGVLYVIGLIVFKNSALAGAGALVFALIAVVGATVIRPDPDSGRERRRTRNRR